MTAHDESSNPAGASELTPEPEAQQRILYLGRSVDTAEMLRALLRDGLHAPVAATLSHSAGGEDHGDERVDNPHLEVVSSQKLALRHIQTTPPTLVLVETSSKRDSRLHFCQALRMRLPGVAIVAVAGARTQPYAFAFDAQVHTPVEPAEALAALRAVHTNASATVLRRGPIRLDLAARRVTSPNGESEMTPKQCALLELLMRSEQVVRRADIMQAIWETSYLEDTRTLDVHIHWLRKMIEPEPAYPIYLITQRGVGYRFTVPNER